MDMGLERAAQLPSSRSPDAAAEAPIAEPSAKRFKHASGKSIAAPRLNQEEKGDDTTIRTASPKASGFIAGGASFTAHKHKKTLDELMEANGKTFVSEYKGFLLDMDGVLHHCGYVRSFRFFSISFARQIHAVQVAESQRI